MWILGVALLLAADSSASTDTAQFREMEKALLNCAALKVELEIDYSPDKDSTSKGLLLVARDNKVFLGLGAVPPIGKDGQIAVVSDGTEMRTAAFGYTHDQKTPRNLTKNILVSVSRTGAFALVDCIAQVAGPKNIPGPFELDTQFSVSDLRLRKKEDLSGKETQVFDYNVTPKNGRKPFGVAVWIDVETNLPVKRVVTVKNDKETVIIKERYSNATLDALKGWDGLFELPRMADVVLVEENVAEEALESVAVSAPPGTMRPWFFQEQDGSSFSRANSLRPMHKSTRRYFAYATVFELSLGTIAYIAAFQEQFGGDDPSTLYGCAALGAVFLVMGSGSLLLLALDALRVRSLAATLRNALRRRLGNEQKSCRYIAQRAHSRGMAIGAVFFGGICALGVSIVMLKHFGIVGSTG